MKEKVLSGSFCCTKCSINLASQKYSLLWAKPYKLNSPILLRRSLLLLTAVSQALRHVPSILTFSYLILMHLPSVIPSIIPHLSLAPRPKKKKKKNFLLPSVLPTYAPSLTCPASRVSADTLYRAVRCVINTLRPLHLHAPPFCLSFPNTFTCRIQLFPNIFIFLCGSNFYPVSRERLALPATSSLCLSLHAVQLDMSATEAHNEVSTLICGL